MLVQLFDPSLANLLKEWYTKLEYVYKEEYCLNSFSQWLQQLQFGTLIDTVLIVAAALLCITFHETCHGLAALWMGDDTAKRAGRLSLNPLRHVDLMGLVVMAVAKFGWAKPVPIDMRNFRNPKSGMALTALAGPVSNLILALAAMFARAFALVMYYRYASSPLWETIMLFFEYVVLLSSGLAVFNMFPIPPLDGSKVFFAFLPARWYDKLMRVERYGMIVLAVLLLTNVLDRPLSYLRSVLLEGLSFLTQPFFEFLIVHLL